MYFICAFRISESRIPIFQIYPVFTPESPSDFVMASFCDIKECNCAIFMCFLCAFRISKSRTAILKNLPWLPLSHPLISASPIFAISKNVIALRLCAFRIPKSRTAVFKNFPVSTL